MTATKQFKQQATLSPTDSLALLKRVLGETKKVGFLAYVPKIQELAAQAGDIINAPMTDSNNCTALTYAAITNTSANGFKALLSEPMVKPNHPDGRGNLALLLVLDSLKRDDTNLPQGLSQQQKLDKLDTLILAGADIHQKGHNPHHSTPSNISAVEYVKTYMPELKLEARITEKALQYNQNKNKWRDMQLMWQG